MGYTNSRAKMKWWDPHIKKLKYFLSAKFDEHNNKFGKLWSPGSTLTTGTNISALTMLKNDLLYHSFIKYDIFEETVNFPPRDTPIIMIDHYCNNHNMSYVSRLIDNRPCKISPPARNITNE